MTIIIILAVVIVLVLWVIGAFNGLVTLKNRAKEAWSDIDVQLKRRYDLIPNLVETVKGYATHERELFEKVTQARANAMSAQGVVEKASAENVLSGTLKSLFAVSEAYPDLKASQNFRRAIRPCAKNLPPSPGKKAGNSCTSCLARTILFPQRKFPTRTSSGWCAPWKCTG